MIDPRLPPPQNRAIGRSHGSWPRSGDAWTPAEDRVLAELVAQHPPTEKRWNHAVGERLGRSPCAVSTRWYALASITRGNGETAAAVRRASAGVLRTRAARLLDAATHLAAPPLDPE